MNTEHKERLKNIYNALKGYLLECGKICRIKLDGEIDSINPSQGCYSGIWPDDFLFPIIAAPELLDKDTKQQIINFLTNSVVGLHVVPDRVEGDGMPMMSPGGYNQCLSYRMPAHLPGAWVRLLSYFEEWGIEIPKKKQWAQIIKRSFKSIDFSCGLVYINPQKPYVGFPFHDNVAVTGFELMTSCVIYRGLQRAVVLFEKEWSQEEIEHWKTVSEAIKKNVHRLYDEKKGAFKAGSKDCQQIDIWGNGLVYGMVDEVNKRKGIAQYYKSQQQSIFKEGCTRQIAEKEGWERLLIHCDLDTYMNGGFWPTGTGYVAPALYEYEPELALSLLEELVEALPKYNYAEWIGSEGKIADAQRFMMSMGLPLVGVMSLLEGKSLLSYF